MNGMSTLGGVAAVANLTGVNSATGITGKILQTLCGGFDQGQPCVSVNFFVLKVMVVYFFCLGPPVSEENHEG